VTEEQFLALIQTQRNHIDILLLIIKHLQKEIKLSLECDDEERQIIIKELIYWIDLLMKEEG